MKVFVVVGTRPEAIKMAPVYKTLKKQDNIDPILVSTGQHREMLDQALNWFNLAPDIDLALMSDRQSLSGLLGRAILKLDDIYVSETPDVVLGQGDTTTVLAAALSAFNRNISFGHVEAGLRTYDLMAPFPEEGNRALTARVTNWHFAPTQRAVDVLNRELVPGEIHLVGNTVVDSLVDTSGKNISLPVECARARLVLITGHRRENHGERFRQAFGALAELAQRHPDCDFVYPVHLNPIVSEVANEILSDIDNFILIPPVAYPEIVSLMKRASLILTDSGGIQEEAPTFGVPVLVMRDTTERQEAVEAGVCELVGVNPEKILHKATEILATNRRTDTIANPFGDGFAASRIAKILSGKPYDAFAVKK